MKYMASIVMFGLMVLAGHWSRGDGFTSRALDVGVTPATRKLAGDIAMLVSGSLPGARVAFHVLSTKQETGEPDLDIILSFDSRNRRKNDWRSLALAEREFVIVVNPDNKVERLTLSQLRDLLTGKFFFWDELGGRKREIKLYVPPKNDPVTRMLETMLLKKQPMRLDVDRVSQGSVLIEAVARDEGGVGVVDRSAVDKRVRIMPVVIDEDDGKRIRFRRMLRAYYKEDLNAVGERFINILVGPDGRDLMRRRTLRPLDYSPSSHYF